MENQNKFLEINDLSFHYRNGTEIFSHVNLSVGKGELLTILGPNGSGKSTLLNCIGKILTPTNGKIFIDGLDIADMSPREMAKQVAYVTQMQSSSFNYTVREYMVMGRSPHLGYLSVPKTEDYEQVDDVLEKLGIQFLADKPYTRISGGERQQIQIGRVLIQDSQLILLDEPSNHLDFGNQIKILRLIKELVESGRSIIMTTHIPDHAIMLGGNVCVIRKDCSIVTGNTDEILTQEFLSDLYDTDLRVVHVNEVSRNTCLSAGL